jgi:hypothetical protein
MPPPLSTLRGGEGRTKTPVMFSGRLFGLLWHEENSGVRLRSRNIRAVPFSLDYGAGGVIRLVTWSQPPHQPWTAHPPTHTPADYGYSRVHPLLERLLV